jgi:hypothetical protein
MDKRPAVTSSVVIPRQLKTFLFDYPSWQTEAFLRVYDHFELNELGIELRAGSNRFYCYNPELRHLTGPFLKEKLEYLCGGEFKFATQTTVVIRKDVNIEQFFKALRPSRDVLLLPDLEAQYYSYLSELFRAMTEQELLKELNDLLDNPPNTQPTILCVPMVEEETGRRVEFEFVVTQLFGWRFVRLAAVKYEGAVFQHCVQKPADTNVYTPDSENVVTLKDYLIAFATDTPFDTARQFIHKLLFTEYDGSSSYAVERIFINREMALVMRLWDYMVLYGEQFFRVEFEKLQADYTIFLE